MAAYYTEEVRRRFGRWVCDIYHNSSHSGLWGKTPLQKWDDLKAHGVSLPPTFDELRAITGLVLPRKVTNKGVTFLGLTYQSDDLQIIRRDGGHKSKMYTVKADPNDMGHILVLDDLSGKWIEVDCIYPDLAEDTTLAEWKEITAIGRKQTQEGQRVSLKVLRRARRELHAEDKLRGNKRRPMTQHEIEAFQVDTESFVVLDDERARSGTPIEERVAERHSKRRAKGFTSQQDHQLRQIGGEVPAMTPANDDHRHPTLIERKVAENDHD